MGGGGQEERGQEKNVTDVGEGATDKPLFRLNVLKCCSVLTES